MIQVVPAILEHTFEEVQKKVQRIQPHTNFIQLDVMDGVFVPNQTFRDPSRVAELPIDMEVHLMIERPSLFLGQWGAVPNVKRLIVHYEAMDNVAHEIQLMRKTGKEVAVAINPETQTFDIREYLPQLDMVVVMGVDPGFSGQEFHKDVLEKIRELKKWRPELLVEVDGGVNMKTRNMIVNAGTDILAAASAIWKAEDIGTAIEDLKSGVKK